MKLKKTSIRDIIHDIKEYSLKVLVYSLHKNPGKNIFSEGWDNLIILDDCRYDVFKEEFYRRNLPGTLKSWISLGSWTGEFLKKNFQEYHPDIVFVSANPFSDVYLKGKVYRLIAVWKTNWDNTYQTVPPRAVYITALKAAKKYPNKRLIVHFLQPHHPYLLLKFKDKTMTVIRESIEKGTLKLDAIRNEPLNALYLSPIYGQFNVRYLFWAYKENLRIVLPYVELLLHKLRGTSIVTSDHGELFGERVIKFVPIEVYGHGIGRNSNLTMVPWWIVKEEDKQNLRSLKEIKREIALIESRFGLRKKTREETRLKLAISSLKLKKSLTIPSENRT